MVNKAAAKLRAQLADQSKIIVCPGVQDGFSARVCLDEGFETLYMVSTSSPPASSNISPPPPTTNPTSKETPPPLFPHVPCS